MGRMFWLKGARAQPPVNEVLIAPKGGSQRDRLENQADLHLPPLRAVRTAGRPRPQPSSQGLCHARKARLPITAEPAQLSHDPDPSGVVSPLFIPPFPGGYLLTSASSLLLFSWHFSRQSHV